MEHLLGAGSAAAHLLTRGESCKVVLRGGGGFKPKTVGEEYHKY